MHSGFPIPGRVFSGRKIGAVLLSAFLAVMLLTSCVTAPSDLVSADNASPGTVSEDFLPADSVSSDPVSGDSAAVDPVSADTASVGTQGLSGSESAGPGLWEQDLPRVGLPAGFDREAVPVYSGSAWADVNDDVPFFSTEEMDAALRLIEAGGIFQQYGELDGIGRCTGACALAGPETLPRKERGSIDLVKPTGWHTVKYDGVDGKYLYNRCHLIGFQLTGQNANEKNLITGTRFMNIEGMLPYEDSVQAYIKGTGKHVLYRVTPVFFEENLLADGVLMEARSVEDPLVQFCAFCFNVQPGISIDYATGESEGAAFTEKKDSGDIPEKQWDYIVNVRTGIFHIPSCDVVKKISRKNRQGFSGTPEELTVMGYKPCGRCIP